MFRTLKNNWKLYLMEAVCLGIFMMSAAFFATVLEYPHSIIHRLIQNDFLRLCLMGVAMGVTAIGIIYSPMGKLSGAHMNPAVTLSFLGLGKIKRHDAIFYILFQLAGGLLAVVVMSALLGEAFRDNHVNYVVTLPGKYGDSVAFLIETGMSFVMMAVVLLSSNHVTTARYTGVVVGIIVASYVIISGPISGFSINPSRTIASAIPAGIYTSFWIYMSAPFIGMFAAAVTYKSLGAKIWCAKMIHSNEYECIFDCGYNATERGSDNVLPPPVNRIGFNEYP